MRWGGSGGTTSPSPIAFATGPLPLPPQAGAEGKSAPGSGAGTYTGQVPGTRYLIQVCVSAAGSIVCRLGSGRTVGEGAVPNVPPSRLGAYPQAMVRLGERRARRGLACLHARCGRSGYGRLRTRLADTNAVGDGQTPWRPCTLAKTSNARTPANRPGMPVPATGAGTGTALPVTAVLS